MVTDVKNILAQLLSDDSMKLIDQWIAKYPSEERQSAVMSALRIAQEEKGFLTKTLMDAIADYLNMPAIAVYEVASFYSMYELSPTGKHLINVCTNVSCQLSGCDKVISHLEKKLSVKMGETTADGLFTLREVECLGACVNAPMLQINKDYHENLTAEKIDSVLETYR